MFFKRKSQKQQDGNIWTVRYEGFQNVAQSFHSEAQAQAFMKENGFDDYEFCANNVEALRKANKR